MDFTTEVRSHDYGPNLISGTKVDRILDVHFSYQNKALFANEPLLPVMQRYPNIQ